jgi:hypothetical protein
VHCSGNFHFNPKGKTMVIENIRDHRHVANGNVYGAEYYTYTSPTHWGSDGLCEITVEYWGDKKPEARLSYSAGGWNKGFNAVEIADAMAEAFAMAKKRLQVLSFNCAIS